MSEDGSCYAIVCGDSIMAKYSSIVPAKMEINRLLEAYLSAEHPTKFQFIKDVKE